MKREGKPTDWFNIHTSNGPLTVALMAQGSRLPAELERIQYPPIPVADIQFVPTPKPNYEVLWPWAGWMQ